MEDVTSHLMPHLSLHPTLRTCSSDTILRGISELSCANTTYTSDTGKVYDFNTATKLNSLLVKVLMNTGQLVAVASYDLDFDHQFIETEKYDAKMTYKKFTGYSPGVAVIGDLIVGIENRDGNANVRFRQQDTLERIFSNLEQNGIRIKRARMDCGSCSRQIVETIEKHSEHFYIRANNCSSLYDCLLALRGWQREEIGRHRAWVEFHPYGEVGGQGMPSCHTAATACGWQSGLVGGRIHVSLHSDQRLYINQPRGCGVL